VFLVLSLPDCECKAVFFTRDGNERAIKQVKFIAKSQNNTTDKIIPFFQTKKFKKQNTKKQTKNLFYYYI